MHWKRLVQFALLVSSDLEQYAILLVRVSIGLFFAISGGNKLFVAGGTKLVYETLVKAEVPFPHVTAYFVSSVEFVGGSLVTVGFLSSPACVALLIDMIVATLTNALSTLPKGLSTLSWLDDFLYLPVPSGSPVRALLWPGEVQCRLPAGRRVTEVIQRRSSLLLDRNLMVIMLHPIQEAK
jgi:putative oxidoreductase